MAPTAYIVHQTRGRVRFRIKEKRGDAEYFETLQTQLASLPPEVEVLTNAATGGVLLIHSNIPYDSLVERIQHLDLFEIAEGPRPEVHALTPLLAAVKKIDQALLASTSGGVDLRTLLFIGAVLVAIRQMRRGEIFSPALPLLWSAMDMVSRLVNHESHGA